MKFFSHPTLLKGSWSSAGFGCERYCAEKGRGGEGGGKEEGERGGKMVINFLMTMHFG